MRLKYVTALFLIVNITISCKDKVKENLQETTKEAVEEVETPLLAEAQYQCPMNCEDGKHYDNAGSCPICKMDLKKVSTETEMTCSVHLDGNCSCEGESCACANCAEHSKTMTCKMHEDGECKCEGEKCACANCTKHA